MNREQFKRLTERLSALNRRKHDDAHTSSVRPAAVLRAEHTLKGWQTKERTIVSKRQDRLAAAYHAARQAITFHDPGDALKALREFERFKP